MEFNWERFKIKNIAVECCNKEEMVDFLDLLENNGIDEHELKECLLEDNKCFKYPIYFEARKYWNHYSVEWSDGTYYQDANYTILKWSDYINCNKEQLQDKLYNIEEELKVVKQQLEELKAKEQLSPRQQFEKDIKCFDIKLSDKDEEKAELREKIYRELTLFARLNNDECDSEYLKDNNSTYYIYFDYKYNEINKICLYTSSEWIPFKSEEVCKAAIELFKDDLLKYYNM